MSTGSDNPTKGYFAAHLFKLQLKMDMKATNTYLFPTVRPHLLFSLVSLDVKISLSASFTTFLFSYKTTIRSFHKDISLELTTES